MTQFNRSEFSRLFSTINRLAGDAALSDATRDSVFDMWWPRLEATVNELLASHRPTESTSRRPDRELIEETLILARTIAKEMPTSRDLAELVQPPRYLGSPIIGRSNWSRETRMDLEALRNALKMQHDAQMSPEIVELLEMMKKRRKSENPDDRAEDTGRSGGES